MDDAAKPVERPVRRTLGGVGFLLDAIRRRRGGRIALWSLVVALALTGAGLLLYPFYTNWQAGQEQGRLTQEIQQVETTPGGKIEWESALGEGKALTRLRIPKLKVNVVVVEGVTWNALKAGAGHYPRTSLPGEPGNVAIAGHRTGFGEPFRHIDRLKTGDEIILTTPFGQYTYQVVGRADGHRNPWITNARDFTVIQPTVEPSLTLTTCDPPGTSKNRLIVRARLVDSKTLV